MKRYLKLSVIFVTVWSLTSFVGVMFDTARAGFWTKSLMTALLTGALLAPLMTFFRPSSLSKKNALQPQDDSMYEGGMNSPENRAPQLFQQAGQQPDFSGGSSSDSFSEQWPFVKGEDTAKERV